MDYLTPEQQEERCDICKQCEKFSFRENSVTYCIESNLDINLTIVNSNIECPLEKF